MPLYNATSQNSAVRENLTFNSHVVPCKLYTTLGALPIADADGWYIKPGTIVKLVADYTVAPCTDATANDAFGIVENGLSIADHAVGTPIVGMPIGVIPFKFGQAIVEVTALEAIAAGSFGKFQAQGVSTFNLTSVTEVTKPGVEAADTTVTAGSAATSGMLKLATTGTEYALADKTILTLAAVVTSTDKVANGTDGNVYLCDASNKPILTQPIYTATGSNVTVVEAEAADNAINADCIVIKGATIPNSLIEVII